MAKAKAGVKGAKKRAAARKAPAKAPAPAAEKKKAPAGNAAAKGKKRAPAGNAAAKGKKRAPAGNAAAKGKKRNEIAAAPVARAPWAARGLVRKLSDGRDEVYSRRFETWVDMFAPHGDSDAVLSRAGEHLDALDDAVFERLLAASAAFRDAFLDAIGEPVAEPTTPRDVLALIGPGTLILEARDEPHVHLELWCDWDREHGLEWSVRGDTIVYVGPFGDHRPFEDRPDSPWNFGDPPRARR